MRIYKNEVCGIHWGRGKEGKERGLRRVNFFIWANCIIEKAFALRKDLVTDFEIIMILSAYSSSVQYGGVGSGSGVF